MFIELRRFGKGARSVGPGLGARLHPRPAVDVAPTNFYFGRFFKPDYKWGFIFGRSMLARKWLAKMTKRGPYWNGVGGFVFNSSSS